MMMNNFWVNQGISSRCVEAEANRIQNILSLGFILIQMISVNNSTLCFLKINFNFML
jgi:hypothetical protein